MGGDWCHVLKSVLGMECVLTVNYKFCNYSSSPNGL